MATIVTRTAKGTALTFSELDGNFTNLNADGIANSASIASLQTSKLDTAGGTVSGALTVNSTVTLGGKFSTSTENNSQSGTAVSLTVPGAEIVRLTNAALVSVSGILAGSGGQKVVLVNRTNTTVEVQNESSSALASSQIFTGTGGSLFLQSNASISLVYDATTNRWNIVGGSGLGTGSGIINYISNSDASIGTTGYTTYDDGSAVPIDGTGGSPKSGLFVRSTITPLRGSGDFNIVKTGATSYQGNGVAYDFTIDNADLSKVLTVSFDYEVVSGTYADGDFTVYLIQDPTGTPTVIQPAGYKILAGSVGTKLKQIATFQTDSSIKNYRLCFHCATTSSIDYTLALDNIVCGPQVVQYGAPITDWQSFTPTVTASTPPTLGTSPTQSGRYRRVGDSMQVEVEIIVGSAGSTAGSGTYYFQLPSGLQIDLSKIASAAIGAAGIPTPFGEGFKADSAGASPVALYPCTDSATGIGLQDVTGATVSGATYGFTAGRRYSFNAVVPILGWSSTVQMSNDTDTRVVSLMATNTTASTTSVPTGSAGTKVLNLSANVDTHGSWSVANQEYTVPVSGYYDITVSVYTAGFSAAVDVGIIRNSTYFEISVFNQTSTQTVTGNTCLFLNAGDKISLGTYQLSGVTQSYGSYNPTRLKLTRVSGPSAIAATETVAAFGQTIAGLSIPNSSWTTVTTPTIVDSTHGAISTGGVFTTPVSGRYFISAAINFTNNGTGGRGIRIIKNASVTGIGNFTTPNAGSVVGCSVSGYLKLVAGDIITMEAFQNSGAALTLSNITDASNTISIVRVGN